MAALPARIQGPMPPRFRSSRWDFAEQMRALPDFLREAITEEADLPGLCRALADGDAFAVVELIDAACEKYADFLLDSPDYDQSVSERMAQLLEVYA